MRDMHFSRKSATKPFHANDVPSSISWASPDNQGALWQSSQALRMCNYTFLRTFNVRALSCTCHTSFLISNKSHAPTHSSNISLPVLNFENCCCCHAAAFLAAPVCTSSSWSHVPIRCSFRTNSISGTSACWDSTEPCVPIPCIRGIGFLDAVVHA